MKYCYVVLLWLVWGFTQACTTAAAVPGESIVVSKQALILQKNPSPKWLSSRVQMALKRVRDASVAIEAGGSASGVIISPDGYVLTVAHLMLMRDKKKPLTVVLEDGRKANLKPLGYNKQHDMALLKITDEVDEPWPFVEIASMPVKLGDFCFTLAHPTGKVVGRSAQVRLGRVTSLQLDENNQAKVIFSDCNIQPGDSGGPLYDLDGRLIGIDSSAVGFVGFNLFTTVTQFLHDKARYLKGDIWGDVKLAPTNAKSINAPSSKEALLEMQKVFMARMKSGHRPTIDFIRSRKKSGENIPIGQQDIINALGKDVYPLLMHQKICMGMDAPFLLNQLPKLPKGAIRPIAVKVGNKVVTYGVPVTKRLLLVKLSEVQNLTVNLRIKADGAVLKIVGRDEAWDLALLDIGNKLLLQPVTWPVAQPKVSQGEALMAPDMYGRMSWGLVAGLAYEVKKGRSLGPLRNKKLVSSRRAPYRSVLPHSLPLFAKDAGTPVYSLAGELVGVHFARLNRTTGLIIKAKDLEKAVRKMLKR